MFLALLIAGLIILLRALSNPGLLEVLSLTLTLVSVRGLGKYLLFFFLYCYLV